MRLLSLSAAILAIAIAGCTEPRSAVCTTVCKRTAECVDQATTKMPFDEKECIAACAALEKDTTDHGAKVKRHVECVNKQTTCQGVLDCK
ncbi:MAG: hypothetical protein AB7O24_11255 [Kofleriaceae bacterium]